jgi:hypothetical protein
MQEALRDAEARATDEMREGVALAQREVGGVVYRVPAVNVPSLREKLDKLIKRAAKNGLGEISYRVDPEVERIERTIDPMVAMVELGYVPPRVQTFRYVALDASVLQLGGWSLLATLSVEPGGVMVSKVPGSDSKDLGAYATEATASLCDHCGLARKRTETFLVEDESGAVKQVGRNCLADFLGTDPHTMVRWMTYISDAVSAIDEEGSYGGGSVGNYIGTEEYLTHVCTAIRTTGWIGASEDYKGTPTKMAAIYNIENYGKKDKWGKDMFEHTTDADAERAAEALAWARETLRDGRSDFDRNMFVAANGEIIPRKGLGVLAYVPVAHAKALEREIERAERARTDAESQYVGEVKERLELALTVTAIYEYAGDYGTTFITTLRDESGNVYKWFGSYELERGRTYTGKWTVKGHEEYKGTKQTAINRPAQLELKEEVAA